MNKFPISIFIAFLTIPLCLTANAVPLCFHETRVFEAPYSIMSKPDLLGNGDLIFGSSANHFEPGSRIIGCNSRGTERFFFDVPSQMQGMFGANPISLPWERYLAVSNDGKVYLGQRTLERVVDYSDFGNGWFSRPFRTSAGAVVELMAPPSSRNFLLLNSRGDIEMQLDYKLEQQINYRYFEQADLFTIEWEPTNGRTRVELFNGHLNGIGSFDLPESGCFPTAARSSSEIYFTCDNKVGYLVVDGTLKATYKGEILLEFLLPLPNGNVIANDNFAGKLFLFKRSGGRIAEVKLGNNTVNRLEIFPDETIATEVWTRVGEKIKQEFVTLNPDLSIRGRFALGWVEETYHQFRDTHADFLTQQYTFVQTNRHTGNQYYFLNEKAEKLFESELYPNRYFHEPVRLDQKTLVVASGGDGRQATEQLEPKGILLRIDVTPCK